MSPSPLQYFLYARKSSENEDKQVASIPSQIDELKKLAHERSLTIVNTFTEDKSAKAPGRPIFNQMLDAIHKGEASGIICWKLDRLARNPIDGGTINWLLQQGIIQHIQTFQRGYFPTDNVLMMNLEFGMANQFVLDLSVNTKRGMRKKVEDGWFPHKPPIGYLSNKHKLPALPPIFKDKDKFTIVKQLWDAVLTKHYTVTKVFELANDLGLKTHSGRRLTEGQCHLMFHNPFYYGYFNWNGGFYKGNHEPMISKQQFDEVQAILDGRIHTCSQKHVFAFTGLIRCGECGAAITAENKTKHQKNGNVHHYTYYRCTKRIKRDCSQQPITVDELEAQITNVLGKIRIPPSFHQWAIKQLKAEQITEGEDQKEIVEAHRRAWDACKKKLDALFDLRLTGEVSPEEFAVHKAKLLKEKHKYEELMKDANDRVETWLERAEKMLNFAETAKSRFELGGFEDKREILGDLGLNLSLLDRNLSIPLKKPVELVEEVAPEVQALHKRLEPRYPLDNIDVYEKAYSKNKNWGRWRGASVHPPSNPRQLYRSMLLSKQVFSASQA
jgi:site-specific DNA recombinase